MNFIELIISQNETQSSHNSFELITSNNIFSQIIKIKEKLSYSDSFKSDLGLYFSHNLLNGK